MIISHTYSALPLWQTLEDGDTVVGLFTSLLALALFKCRETGTPKS